MKRVHSDESIVDNKKQCIEGSCIEESCALQEIGLSSYEDQEPIIEKIQELSHKFYDYRQEYTIADIVHMEIPDRTKVLIIEKMKEIDEMETFTQERRIKLEKLMIELKKIKKSVEREFELDQKEETIKKKYPKQQSRERIINSLYPDKIKASLLHKNEHTQDEKMSEYINLILSIPINKKELCPFDAKELFLTRAKKIMDVEIYGQENVKDALLYILSNILSNPNSTFLNVGLVGKPGTGKTALCRALSKITNLPMKQISLGNIDSVSTLVGHDYTYLGSKPGMIAQSFISMECINGILYFDELDKINNDVSNVLVHLTDDTQNVEFYDKYFGINFPMDLSKIFYIFSMNNEENVDKILRDRMNIIKMEEYSKKDKGIITQEYLIPKITTMIGVYRNDIILDSKLIEIIINKCQSKGESIRTLQVYLLSLYRKINYEIMINKRQKPVYINE